MAAAVEDAKRALERLKHSTLEVSKLCNHPATNEESLRRGLVDLDQKIRDMEPRWEQLSPGKKKAYTEEARMVQERALKHVRIINPNIKTLEHATGIEVPLRNEVMTRSKKRRRDTEQSAMEQDVVEVEARRPDPKKRAPDQGNETSASEDRAVSRKGSNESGRVTTVARDTSSEGPLVSPGNHSNRERNVSPGNRGVNQDQNSSKRPREGYPRRQFVNGEGSRQSRGSYSNSRNYGNEQVNRSYSSSRNYGNEQVNRSGRGFGSQHNNNWGRGRQNFQGNRNYNNERNRYGRDRDRFDQQDSLYYPKESHSKFVPPEVDQRFGKLDFPQGWALPSASQFKQYFDKVDILPMLGKFGAFGHFEGTIESYPGWQDNFYRVVHVQAVPLIHKVNAMDQAVSAEIKRTLFKDLSSSAEDYLIRIKRLEKEYGDNGKHRRNMIARIKAIGEIGRDHAKVRDAAFALERYIDSRYCRDPHDPFIADLIIPLMRSDVRREYRAYVHDNGLEEDPVSIHGFLSRVLEIEEDPKKHLRGEHKSKAKDKVEGKKNAVKPKLDVSKKANYQFYNRPETSSEESEDSFANESFEGDSEDGVQVNVQKKGEICDFCQGWHNLFRCITFFYEMSYAQRRKWVINEKRCPLCLKEGHKRANCKNKRACRFCNGEHNTCIHVEAKKKKASTSGSPVKPKKNTEPKAKKEKTLKPKEEETSDSDEALVHSSRRAGKSIVSLTTFVAQLQNPETGEILPVNALADSGADHTILSTRAARSLGLWQEGGGSDYFVKGHGGSKGCYKAQKLAVSLLDDQGKFLRKIQLASYEKPCGDLKVEDWHLLKNNWAHLQDLPLPKPVGDGIVDLILGSSAVDLMEATKPVLFGPPGGPIAKYTGLGWIVGGKTRPGNTTEEQVLADDFARVNFSLGRFDDKKELRMDYECRLLEFENEQRNREDMLRRDLKALWGRHECCKEDLRNAKAPAVRTKKEKQAEASFKATSGVDNEGFAEVGLLWQSKERPRNNWRSAFRIFLNLETRMKTHPKLWEEFEKNVAEWLRKGYAKLLDFEKRKQGFFIPTFMVVREDKSTTKYRLIVNGKFEFQGKCINDFLLSGPNVMNKLAEVLIRFRYHKYVVTCDISNMFLRVRVPAGDRKFLRFFYRDQDGQIKIVQMCSHAFGLTQSPYVVINTVKTLATNHQAELPLAAEAVLKDSIVDDILTGCKTHKNLLALKKEIEQLYDKINLSAHKWATNSPSLRELIEPDLRAGSVSLGQENEDLFCCEDPLNAPSIKCLGILWHPAVDRIQFMGPEIEKGNVWTMRRMSSQAGRLFDPLGIMTPLMLKGKLLLQSLWKLDLGWDAPVPDAISNQFDKWLGKMQGAHLSHINRRVKAAFKTQAERLIVFTDASSQAQAAVAYLWCKGERDCSGTLWASKQKISSLNRSDSIARLELEGAVMGVELSRQICEAMCWDMNQTIYFTDSTTVLWWLRSDRELDVFVGNRVCKILDYSNVKQWFHVRTLENPADIPTRGMSGKKLANCKLWWEGPLFFKEPMEKWPEQPEVVESRCCEEGYRKSERKVEGWLLVNVCSEQGLDSRSGWPDNFWYKIIEKHSDLRLGFSVAVRVFKFLGRFKRFYYSTTYARCLRYLELVVLREAQRQELAELKNALALEKDVPKEFAELKPVLDADGLIRVGGRLKDSTRLAFEVRCPIILSGKGNYAEKLIRHVHEKELRHCGGRKTLATEVRKKIWVTGMAVLVKRVLKNCVWCERAGPVKPMVVDKAPLHFTRLPLPEGCGFSEIGIDMAGPFHCKQGRSRAVCKKYVLLFSCCWTRALNLEVMDSASTESCVSAFVRHCNVYGFPSYVNSDRGSNFVGAERHLKEQWTVVEQALKQRSIDWPMIRWKFNPPYSPRFTGHVEIMVKIMKKNLRNILGQSKYLFRDEELCTMVKMAQGYANSRPLTEPSNDCQDPPSLCPADFLLTGSRFLGSLPELNLDNYSNKTRKEMIGKVNQELWEALITEYISELQKVKGARGAKELEVGDVVLILDKTLPTGRYCMGRVKTAKTNPDGKARSFEIEHQGEILTRSAMTLAPLESLKN